LCFSHKSENLDNKRSTYSVHPCRCAFRCAFHLADALFSVPSKKGSQQHYKRHTTVPSNSNMQAPTVTPSRTTINVEGERHQRFVVIQQVANSIFSRMDADRAPAAVDRTFKSLFGCSIAIAYFLWMKMCYCNEKNMQGSVKHMLWALCFLKLYPTEDQMSVWFNADRITVRKWVWIMLHQMAYMHHNVVSMLLLNIFLIVDNCLILFPSF